MRKVLFAIAGLMLLFFASNGSSYDCDSGCAGLAPLSKWCKCATECNSNNPECVQYGTDCIEGWGGGYLEFDECMKDLLPFDNLWCVRGNTCPQAVCTSWMQYFGWIAYKNIGQCIVDQAAKYGNVPIGFWGEDDYWWCDSEEGRDVTWIEACECIHASGCDPNNPPE